MKRETMTILSREQSYRLNERLEQLCSTGIPGTEIKNIIKQELGLDWSLQGVFSRVKRLGHPWVPTPRKHRILGRAGYLEEDQWQACYEDPAYEARRAIVEIGKGIAEPEIAERVICRECIRVALDDPTRKHRVPLLKHGSLHGKNRHLADIHGITGGEEEYHRRHSEALLFTGKRLAELCKPKKTTEQYITERAQSYATPEELKAALKDPYYEGDIPYVICRVARCGFKSCYDLGGHLKNAHELTVKDYRRTGYWPLMPKRTLAEHAQREATKRRDLKNKAWRPDGWHSWSADEQAIGIMLIENPDLSGNEIGIRLDESRLKCPWGDGWQRSLTTPGTGANVLSKIRKKIAQRPR